jgi:hypothetical protein
MASGSLNFTQLGEAPDGFAGCVGTGVATTERVRKEVEPLMLKYGVDVSGLQVNKFIEIHTISDLHLPLSAFCTCICHFLHLDPTHQIYFAGHEHNYEASYPVAAATKIQVLSLSPVTLPL